MDSSHLALPIIFTFTKVLKYSAIQNSHAVAAMD